ncbi:TPA: CAT RNA binding domain-containing protein [Enterococcus faecium]|uniref:CAT RNA binding domain-containing protein n=1 Tax=Enterococcus TaxID=1350 RepID=UPI0035E1E524
MRILLWKQILFGCFLSLKGEEQPMQVIATLNHNAIIAKSEEGEWVLIKKGIGFGRKIGDPINERDVESVYQKI